MSVYHHSVKAVRIASYVWRLHGLCSCCTPATEILCLFRNSRYDCTRSLRPYSVQAAQGNVSLPLVRLVKSFSCTTFGRTLFIIGYEYLYRPFYLLYDTLSSRFSAVGRRSNDFKPIHVYGTQDTSNAKHALLQTRLHCSPPSFTLSINQKLFS